MSDVYSYKVDCFPIEKYKELGLHHHCSFCYNLKCKVKPEDGISCKLILCSNNCGMIFHACKEKEHLLLCDEVKVACYNAENGCPFKMKKKLLSQHLEKCPASIVHCTMEWHRSLEVSDRNSFENMHEHCLTCYNVNYCTEVIVECAIINCPRHCGARMHECNYSNHKFLCPNEKIPCINPGCDHICQRRFLKKHFIVCPKNNFKNDGYMSSLNHFNRSFKKMPLDVALALRDLHLLKWLRINHIAKDIASDLWYYPQQISTVQQKSLIPEDGNEKLTKLISNLKQVYEFQRLSRTMEDDNDPEKQFIWKYVQQVIAENQKLMVENQTLKSRMIEPSCLNILNSIFGNLEIADSKENPYFCFSSEAFNSLSMYPTRFLGLGRREVRMPNGCQEYTFFCSQVFRRDEYASHYKNVHLDIQGGFSGGIQERCPLALYGCTFSRQLLTPAPNGSEIVYNDYMESFGVSPFSEIQQQSSPNATNLLDLPDELLEHIASWLDGFSLTNLYYTSKRLNAVCTSLLTEKGIVQIKWGRKETIEGCKWEDVGKTWKFTSHFSSIQKWVFQTGNTIADHLKSCPFNNRLIRTQRYSHDAKGYLKFFK